MPPAAVILIAVSIAARPMQTVLIASNTKGEGMSE
jgi:hypothetical protein